MTKVAPSLLAADFLHLEHEIGRMAEAGADYLHFDVMDGQFVPNISFGFPLMAAARKGPLPLDVHLMIERPEQFIDAFAKAGASIITVHQEATKHLDRCLHMIRDAGCLAGIALNPHTAPDDLRYLMGEFDLVLVMTINPGFGGQKMLPGCIQKIADVRALLDSYGRDAIIEVDGGVNMQNAALLSEKGASLLVAGTACFGAEDPGAFIEHIHSLG
ncbi:MAG: ribulose-phosphate 3-epimerase [Clostridiales bacterium]|nr:ribulose-phosphate 3-epimerase [Clostridiales bacterium]